MKLCAQFTTSRRPGEHIATARTRSALASPRPATPLGAETHTPNKHGHQIIRKVEDQLMGGLAGKVAVITGGSSGIGLATAQRFVDEWAHVFIVCGRHNARGEADNTL